MALTKFLSVFRFFSLPLSFPRIGRPHQIHLVRTSIYLAKLLFHLIGRIFLTTYEKVFVFINDWLWFIVKLNHETVLSEWNSKERAKNERRSRMLEKIASNIIMDNQIIAHSISYPRMWIGKGYYWLQYSRWVTWNTIQYSLNFWHIHFDTPLYINIYQTYVS